jgi:hypothetical protein
MVAIWWRWFVGQEMKRGPATASGKHTTNAFSPRSRRYILVVVLIFLSTSYGFLNELQMSEKAAEVLMDTAKKRS